MTTGNYDMPELIAENGESTVRATLETHFISPAAFDILLRDPFTRDDFEAFLAERQRTIRPRSRICSSKSVSTSLPNFVSSTPRSRGRARHPPRHRRLS